MSGRYILRNIFISFTIVLIVVCGSVNTAAETEDDLAAQIAAGTEVGEEAETETKPEAKIEAEAKDRESAELKDLKNVPKHVEMEPASPEKINYVITKMLENKRIDLSYKPKAPNIGGPEFTDWQMNYIQIEGDLNEIELLFERPPDPEQTGPEAFKVDVGIHFGSSGQGTGGVTFYYLIRHEEGEEKFVRLTSYLVKQKRFFLRSDQGASLVAVLPQMKRGGIGSIIFCPRHITGKAVKLSSRRLRQTDYQLTGVKFPMSDGLARLVEGRLQTGVSGQGAARALIQTTPNIPAASPHVDSIVGDYPFVSVLYNPESSAVMTKNLDWTKGVIGGIRHELILNNSLSQEGKIWKDYVISVGKATLKKPFVVIYRKGEFQVDPGDCYVLLKEIREGGSFIQRPPKRPVKDDLLEMIEKARKEQEELERKRRERNKPKTNILEEL